jgi:hypothetical protein
MRNEAKLIAREVVGWTDDSIPLLRPKGGECAAVLAVVKGKPPLTRRWPPATLDHRCARRPVRYAGRRDGRRSNKGMHVGRLNQWLGRYPSVDAPFGARRIFRLSDRVVESRHLSGLCCGRLVAAGPYGSSWIGTKSHSRALSTVGSTGFPDLVSSTVAPYFPLDFPTPPTTSGSCGV